MAFIVTCDTGYNHFFLASQGWTTDRARAVSFTSRAAANVARRRSYKTKRDKTAIEVEG